MWGRDSYHRGGRPCCQGAEDPLHPAAAALCKAQLSPGHDSFLPYLAISGSPACPTQTAAHYLSAQTPPVPPSKYIAQLPGAAAGSGSQLRILIAPSNQCPLQPPSFAHLPDSLPLPTHSPASGKPNVKPSHLQLCLETTGSLTRCNPRTIIKSSCPPSVPVLRGECMALSRSNLHSL